jgi:hypothetical protein
MASTLKFSKQSLVDWYVEDEGQPAGKKVVARISKVKLGYEVYLRMFNFEGPYFYGSFKEAKACAMDPASHPA